MTAVQLSKYLNTHILEGLKKWIDFWWNPLTNTELQDPGDSPLSIYSDDSIREHHSAPRALKHKHTTGLTWVDKKQTAALNSLVSAKAKRHLFSQIFTASQSALPFTVSSAVDVYGPTRKVMVPMSCSVTFLSVSLWIFPFSTEISFISLFCRATSCSFHSTSLAFSWDTWHWNVTSSPSNTTMSFRWLTMVTSGSANSQHTKWKIWTKS